MNPEFKQKYLKYKNKYLNLKNQTENQTGGSKLDCVHFVLTMDNPINYNIKNEIFNSDLYKYTLENINHISYDELIKNSDEFNDTICKFPRGIEHRIKDVVMRESNQQTQQQIKEEIQDYANSVFSIMHINVRQLISDFISYKLKSGTDIEKQYYNTYGTDAYQNFIYRLLSKRPMAFYNESDTYRLRKNGTENITGDSDNIFDNIGKPTQDPIVNLENYISYDEMQISALLGVAVPTLFINKGHRQNKGIYEKDSKQYTKKGIYVGLVGTRFERKELMEYQHIIITATQNTKEKGYGNLQKNESKLTIWEKFYGEEFPTYEEAQQNIDRYVRIVNIYSYDIQPIYFNKSIYKKRIKMSVLPFLMHANDVAIKEGKKAHCRVVGLGLGVWAVAKELQTKLMLEVYKDILNEYDFSNISNIEFLYMNSSEISFKDLSKNKSIILNFTQGEPANPIPNPNPENNILVAMYAWDGNSFPGNEYWDGGLTASGDPAAACCSLITELQNPYINTSIINNPTLFYDKPIKSNKHMFSLLKIDVNRNHEYIKQFKDFIPSRLSLKINDIFDRLSCVISKINTLPDLNNIQILNSKLKIINGDIIHIFSVGELFMQYICQIRNAILTDLFGKCNKIVRDGDMIKFFKEQDDTEYLFEINNDEYSTIKDGIYEHNKNINYININITIFEFLNNKSIVKLFKQLISSKKEKNDEKYNNILLEIEKEINITYDLPLDFSINGFNNFTIYKKLRLV